MHNTIGASVRDTKPMTGPDESRKYPKAMIRTPPKMIKIFLSSNGIWKGRTMPCGLRAELRDEERTAVFETGLRPDGDGRFADCLDI